MVKETKGENDGSNGSNGRFVCSAFDYYGVEIRIGFCGLLVFHNKPY